MSLELNDLDRIFAEGLQNYEEVPSAHVWQNIQKGKRRGVFYYLSNNKLKVASLLLLLLTAGFGSYYLIQKNNAQKQVSTSNNTRSAIDKPEIENHTQDANKVHDDLNFQQPIHPRMKNDGEPLKNQKDKDNNFKDNPSKDNNSKNKPFFPNKKKHNKANLKSPETSRMVSENSDLEALKIKSREEVRLRYLIYPSLTQFVYTSKKLFKKYDHPSSIEPVKEKLNYKFSIELVGGPSYAFRNLSGEGTALRNESEIAALSVQTGIKINYHFNPTWSFQSGIVIENRNEKINYEYLSSKTTLTQTPRQVTIFHPVLPPRTVTVIDSVYTEESVDNKFNTTNKYTSFSIPIMLGYNFAMGRLQYRVSVGSLVNIYSTNAASILENRNGDVVLTPYVESTKIKPSVYSAFGVQMPLNNKVNLIGELSYYHNMTNRLKDESAMKQKNYGVNLSAGLKFNLIR